MGPRDTLRVVGKAGLRTGRGLIVPIAVSDERMFRQRIPRHMQDMQAQGIRAAQYSSYSPVFTELDFRIR